MEPIEARGQHVRMLFDGHMLVIERKGFTASMAGGHHHRRIPISQIASVNFKPASTLFRGHFQVLTAGGHASHDVNPMTRGMTIAQDPNAAVFPKKRNAEWIELNEAIYSAQLRLGH